MGKPTDEQRKWLEELGVMGGERPKSALSLGLASVVGTTARGKTSTITDAMGLDTKTMAAPDVGSHRSVEEIERDLQARRGDRVVVEDALNEALGGGKKGLGLGNRTDEHLLEMLERESKNNPKLKKVLGDHDEWARLVRERREAISRRQSVAKARREAGRQERARQERRERLGIDEYKKPNSPDKGAEGKGGTKPKPAMEPKSGENHTPKTPSPKPATPSPTTKPPEVSPSMKPAVKATTPAVAPTKPTKIGPTPAPSTPKVTPKSPNIATPGGKVAPKYVPNPATTGAAYARLKPALEKLGGLGAKFIGSAGRVAKSVKVPLSMALEVLTAIQFIEMTESAVRGEGFIFTQQIAQAESLRKDVNALVKAYKDSNLHQDLSDMVAKARKIDAEDPDGLYGSDMLSDYCVKAGSIVSDHKAACEKLWDHLTTIDSDVTARSNYANALFNDRGFWVAIGIATRSSVIHAELFVAIRDMQRILSAISTAKYSLEPHLKIVRGDAQVIETNIIERMPIGVTTMDD